MMMVEISNSDCLELLPELESGSVDVVLTDPPYLYLQKQRLERPFDERKFFSECKRVLTKNGFIVLFGRGASFYRWNTILDELGFTFKEEIVWNKRQSTSPLLAVSRIHETVSIWTPGNGTINKVKIPYLEAHRYDLKRIVEDVKRLCTCFGNQKSLVAVRSYLESNSESYEELKPVRHNATIQPSNMRAVNRATAVAVAMQRGLNEKSVIYGGEEREHFGLSVQPSALQNQDRACNAAMAVNEGLNEKSVIQETRDHYNTIHPTQKPVRLLERLLALVLPKNKPREDVVVLDPFGGSFSTVIAARNLGCRAISCEIDKEYYEAGINRLVTLFKKSQTECRKISN